MVVWRSRAGPPGLGSVVNDSFRTVIAGLAVIILLGVGLLTWTSLYSRPMINRYQVGLAALQASHTAMLDQETGVRGYLVTGDTRYLAPYRQGRIAMAAAEDGMLPLAREADLTRPVLDVLVTQRAWSDGWATPRASAPPAPAPGAAGPAASLSEGKALFDSYRQQHRIASERAAATLDRVWARQFVAVVGVIAAAVVIGCLLVLASADRRRALQRDVLKPVEVVLTGLDEVRQGRFDQPITSTGPAELLAVVEGFNLMTRTLGRTSVLAEQRDRHITEQAERLRAILRIVREIGGSLNLTYVLKSVIEGVEYITAARHVIVWIVDEDDGVLVPVRSSEPAADDGPEAGPRAGAEAGAGAAEGEPVELGTGVVGRAAKYGRSTHGSTQDGDSARHMAVPLIIGARVIGVLEIRLPDAGLMSDEQIEVLETLSVHAAAAIEAARLHATAAHASEHDPLTRLANRRRLEADLALECERSLRHGRPAALIMIDLDHFKRVNDTYGHTRGDEILQAVAETLGEGLRATDTAYRYGGEELVVLARDSDGAAAATLADRLRDAVQRRFAGPGEGGVTASFGIAAVPEHAATPKALVDTADQALYVSKQAGRNRVTVAATRPDRRPAGDHAPAVPAAASPQ